MSDSRKVRWGVLGTAVIATKVADAIRRSRDGELVAIASRDLSKAKDWASKHNVPQALGSYQELVDHPDIDAIYMPLPPTMHLEWTTKCAERGKHVLSEKPVAGHVADAIAMADVCKKHQVQLMDGVFWVHHHRAKKFTEVLGSGVLGKLKRITSAFSFHWDVTPDQNIRMKPELAGGSLFDLGYYCVRATWWFTRKLPTKVWAHARFVNGVDYELSAQLWFDDGVVASFDCSFDTVMRQWFEVAGTKGSIVCDDFVLSRDETKSRFWIHDDQEKATVNEIGPCVAQVEMINDFCDLVLSGKRDDSWPNQAIITQHICDCILKSARENRAVDVPCLPGIS